MTTCVECMIDRRSGRDRQKNLGGFGVVQVPELDMAVASSNKVGAVVREGDGGDLTRHLIGCDNDVFLINTNNQCELSKRGLASPLI